MMNHLSERRILAWQMNEQTAQESEHVQGCDRCRAQVGRLNSSIALYRSSVIAWSDAHECSGSRTPWVTPSGWRVWRRAALQWTAAAALALAVVAPVYTHRLVEERREERARADQALLEQVDQEVSQTVPDTMEPLTDLVTWEPMDDSLSTNSKTQSRRTK